MREDTLNSKNFTNQARIDSDQTPRSLERLRLQSHICLAAGDTTIIYGSLTIAIITLYKPSSYFNIELLSIAILNLLIFYCVYIFVHYNFIGRNFCRPIEPGAHFPMGLVLLTPLTLLFFQTAVAPSDPARLICGTLGLGGLAAFRVFFVARLHRSLEEQPHSVLLIDDDGPQMDHLAGHYVCARAQRLVPDTDDPYALNMIGKLFQNMDRIVVSCPVERRLDWARVMRAAGVRGEIITNRHDNRVASLVSKGPLGIQQRTIKRIVDLGLTLPALVLLLPLLLCIAMAIKLEDGGRIFFVQRRVGRRNAFFDIFKFRTMREADADADGTQSTSRNDTRITRVGSVLRRTSLDELPQLFNVVLGDMSLVGPRPHALGSQAGSRLFWKVDKRYWERHALKPGLTGLAQIRGHRGATDTERDLTDRLKSDLEYVQNWSAIADLVILFSTVKVLVHNRAF